MLSQEFHTYRYTLLMARVRRRSAVIIFFAFSAFFAISPPQVKEICNNGVDDDLDGLIDCDDPACKGGKLCEGEKTGEFY